MKHTEQTKKLISEKRIIYLQNNPDKHPWKNNKKFTSKPCDIFKSYLDEKNIKYVAEFKPLYNRQFSIDIAFPDLKIGIEINGNQHYDNEGKLKPYYQERHDLIENNGWVLYEIHYTTVFSNIDTILAHITLGTQPDYTEYFALKEKRKRKKPRQNYPKPQRKPRQKRKYVYVKKTDQEKYISKIEGIEKSKRTQELNYKKKVESLIPLVVNSGIDFKKFGWRTKVAKVIGISPQKVGNWMAKNMPEFYKECHVR